MFAFPIIKCTPYTELRKVMDEMDNKNSDSTYFRIYILVLGVYMAIRIAFALLAKIPALHTVSELSDRWPFFQFFKWIYQVCFLAPSYGGPQFSRSTVLMDFL